MTDRVPTYAVPLLPDQVLRVGDAQYLLAWDWKFSVEHAISIWPSGQIYEEW